MMYEVCRSGPAPPHGSLSPFGFVKRDPWRPDLQHLNGAYYKSGFTIKNHKYVTKTSDAAAPPGPADASGSTASGFRQRTNREGAGSTILSILLIRSEGCSLLVSGCLCGVFHPNRVRIAWETCAKRCGGFRHLETKPVTYRIRSRSGLSSLQMRPQCFENDVRRDAASALFARDPRRSLTVPSGE